MCAYVHVCIHAQNLTFRSFRIWKYYSGVCKVHIKILKLLENHGMAEVGRHLWRFAGPTPLLKQVSVDPVAQIHGQAAFEYLQGWRLPGQPVSPPHNQKVFPDVQTASCVSFLCSLPLVVPLKRA